MGVTATKRCKINNVLIQYAIFFVQDLTRLVAGYNLQAAKPFFQSLYAENDTEKDISFDAMEMP